MNLNNFELDRDFYKSSIKEKLMYLYIEKNFSMKEIQNILDIPTKSILRNILKENNIPHKSKEQIKEIRRRTTSFRNPEIQAKCRETIKKKYGGPAATCNSQVLAKQKATNIKLFGCQSAQRHLSKETRNIINYKENLEKFILNLLPEERTFHNIAKLLGMHHSQIGKRVRQYDLEKLILKNPLKSQYEKDIHDYILKHYNLDFEFHNRDQIINPVTGRFMELDLFYRPLKLAIEFNSTRWHTKENGKGEKYHCLKENLCKEKGILLLFLWQKDWIKDRMKDIVKIQIEDFIERRNVMNFSADGQNKTTINLDDIKLKDVVKEVVREELKDDLNKMKEQQNQHLQEGNMYLNE